MQQKTKLLKNILIVIVVLFFFLASSLSILCWNYYKKVFKDSGTVKIVVASNNGGQLCNQLWHFAQLAAFCKERGYELYNPAFFRYAKHFEHFQHDIVISPTNSFNFPSPLVSEIQRRSYKVVIGLLKNHYPGNRFYCTDENHPLVLPPTSLDFPELTSGDYFFFDWHFSNPEGLEKHCEYIREILAPKKKYLTAIDQFWKTVDQKRLIVGVHIRYGDFRRWANGAFFIPLDNIKEHMQRIATHFQDLNPLFIIYSDEPQNEGEFSDFDVKISHGNLIVDLYSLSRCDLIMGVGTSTYNAWAAWYGQRPRYTFDQPPPLEDLEGAVRGVKTLL